MSQDKNPLKIGLVVRNSFDKKDNSKSILRNVSFTVGMGNAGKMDYAFFYHELPDAYTDQDILKLQTDLADDFHSPSRVPFNLLRPPIEFTHHGPRNQSQYVKCNFTPEEVEAIHTMISGVVENEGSKYLGVLPYSVVNILS